MLNPGAQTRPGEPGSALSSPQDPGSGLREQPGDTGSTPNHQQHLKHIVRRAAVQDKVRAQSLPQFPAPSWPARPSLPPLEFGFFSPVSFNSPAQLSVSHKGLG